MALASGVWASRAHSHDSIATCAPVVRAVVRLPERIDSLLAVGDGETVVALAGAASGIRYLPHDDLLVLSRRRAHPERVALPPYVTPPGLVVAGVPPAVYALVDSTLLRLDPATERLAPVRRLDLQAIGWPAAIAAANGRLYVVGQPRAGWAAEAEALAVAPRAHARLLWRAALGLTHAGAWLGLAGAGRLAVYLPDAHDAAGSIALLDVRTGALRGAYAVPAPPDGADVGRDRLYIAGAGTVRALTLDRGRPVAVTQGGAPLALDASRGLIAFASGSGIALASARTLRRLGHLALPGVTALAATTDGRTLLAGFRSGVAWVDIRSCQA